MRQIVLIAGLLMATSVCAATAQSHPSPRARPRLSVGSQQAGAPHLLWRAPLSGQATVHLAGVGAGRIAVTAEPTPRMVRGNWVPQPTLIEAFDAKTGFPAWSKELLAWNITAVADDTRLYARVQLPQISYDPFDQPLGEFRHELATFRWSDGRMGWHIPAPSSGALLAYGGRVIYDGRTHDGEANHLVAVDGASGQESWRVPTFEMKGLMSADGKLYAYNDARDPEGEYLRVLDPATGQFGEPVLLYPEYRPFSHLAGLVWSRDARVLVAAIANDSTPGSNEYGIRALDALGKPAWEAADTKGLTRVGNALICESFATGRGGMPHGVVALDPATGRPLWRRPARIDVGGHYDLVVGEWRGAVVVLLGNVLCGLEPRTGRRLWTADTTLSGSTDSAKQATIYDGVIVLTVDGTKGRAAQVIGLGLGPARAAGRVMLRSERSRDARSSTAVRTIRPAG